MFARWGRFVYRHRRLVAIASVLVALSFGAFAARVTDELSSGGWVDTSSESFTVQERVAEEFQQGKSSFIALYRGQPGSDARSDGFQAAMRQSLEPLRSDPRVVGIVGFAETRGDPRFISNTGDASYAVVNLHATDEEAVNQIDELRAQIAPAPGLTMQLTGYAPISKDANEQSERDLQLAETVSLPIALLILVAVFASFVAAGMPLLVAALAIPTTLGSVFFLAERTEMSIYVLNVSTMLGLALAIDYSLFLVSRFREELGRGHTTGEAVERAVATAGKAVTFSALAVAIGLSGLLFFEASALTSIGVAGSLTVAFSALYAITFLPAILGMLGPRVNSLGLGGLFRRLTGRPAPAPAAIGAHREGRWERVAHVVMKHPLKVLAPTLVFLLLLGVPFLRLDQGIPGPEVLPAGVESRDAAVALQRDFPAGEASPITILVESPMDPTSPDAARALAAYAESLRRVDGITRVDGAFSLRDPLTGRYLTPDEVAQLYAAPVRPPQVQEGLDRALGAYVRGNTVRFDAIAPYIPSDPRATDMIPGIRAVGVGEGFGTPQIGGAAAAGRDFLDSMSDRIPLAVGTTMLAMLVVLFLLFGSVVLPIKAVIMTLLSLTASFGALVWIFQEGNLSNFLGFETPGYTVAGNPVIMFAVLFGLSMDYEVLLLSRIQEAYRRTGDNTASVAEGLGRTAAVITGAALIMVTVFAAFALAQIVTIKAIGVGMAIAVFLDATIIRVLLVPATMRLMGHYNWWAPGPLGRLADKLGFSHVEADEEPARSPTAERTTAPA